MIKEEPVHPGKLIREQIIAKNGLSVTQAAHILKVGRQALSALLNERAALSPEMAFRIEKAFGIKMDVSMKFQLAYDLYHLRKRDAEFDIVPYRGERDRA